MRGKRATTLSRSRWMQVKMAVRHCITAKFIYDTTSCAPDNGFGLSASTRPGALVGIVCRNSEMILADVIANVNKETEIAFAGGYTSPWAGIYGNVAIDDRSCNVGQIFSN